MRRNFAILAAILAIVIVSGALVMHRAPRELPAQMVGSSSNGACFWKATAGVGSYGGVSPTIGGGTTGVGSLECKWAASNPGFGWSPSNTVVEPNCADCALSPSGGACICTAWKCTTCRKEGTGAQCSTVNGSDSSCNNACSGNKDCFYSSVLETSCSGTLCQHMFCGDGVCDAWEKNSSETCAKQDCTCGGVPNAQGQCKEAVCADPNQKCVSNGSAQNPSCACAAASAVCGNGIKEGNEACDDGAKNVPASLANISWDDLQKRGEDGDPALSALEESGCLEGCKLAACSDTKDNDDDSAADGADPGCHIGSCADCEVLQTAYLPGRNSEDNPCAIEDKTYDESGLLGYDDASVTAALIARVDEPGEECKVKSDDCKNGKLCVAWGTQDEPDGRGRCTECKQTGEVCGANWHCCKGTDLCVRQSVGDTTYDAHCRQPNSIHVKSPPCTGGQANNGGFPIFVLPAIFPTSNGGSAAGDNGGTGAHSSRSGQNSNASGGGSSGSSVNSSSSSSSAASPKNSAASSGSSKSPSSSASSASSFSSLLSSSALSSSSSAVCGDGKTESPEQCDNGSVCGQNPYVACVTPADCKLCMVVGGVKRCEGLLNGKLCNVSADCADTSDACIFNLLQDPTCNAQCMRAVSSSSSRFSSAVSSSAVSVASSASVSPKSSAVSAVSSARSSARSSVVGNAVSSTIASSVFSSAASSVFSSVSSEILGMAGYCGDGTKQTIEECDDRNATNGDGCSSTCKKEEIPKVVGFCGDGTRQLNELCDDGNKINGDGCSSTCVLELRPTIIIASSAQSIAVSSPPTLVAAASVCGNGVLEAREECDDGNRRSSDGCSDSCLLEIGICGDGKVQQLLGEQCESSTFDVNLPYDCVNCHFVSRECGDGKLDPGEECDKGSANSNLPNAACRPNCALSRCGDNIQDTGEECDDGNRQNGDSCDSACRTEKKPSAVLAEKTVERQEQKPTAPQPITNYQSPITNIPFPFQQQYQQMPQYLPYAQLQPLLQQVPQTTQSGPAAVAAIGAGAAAGMSWVRRRRK